MSLTAKQMNTDLAQRLKALFDSSRKRRYEAFREAEKLKKKQGGEEEGAEHVDGNELPKGILGKDGQYAQRGSDYIRSQDGRGVYRNFYHPHLEQIRELVRKAAEFPGGPPANFDPGAVAPGGGAAGQQYPYLWEAHHMLPGSAFYYETSNGPCFTFAQLRLLLQTDYNINHGHNIIMLPDESWAVPVHSLLAHPSDHPEYTQRVMTDLSQIANKIQKKIDQQEPHKAITDDLFQQLKNLEDGYWDYIVNLSRAVVAAVSAGQTFTHPNVRFSTAKGSTQYEYGALY